MSFQPRRAIHGATQQINKDIDGVLMFSAGYTVDATYATVPSYTSEPVKLQLQELTADEMKFIDNIQMQAISQAMYMYAQADVIDRVNQTGGDLLVFGGATWLVVVVSESWHDYCRIVVRKQLDNTP